MAFINRIVFDGAVVLAPLAGVSDLVFRILCKEQGADIVYTEMVSAKGIFYDNKNTKDLLVNPDGENPCVVQLFGSDPDIMGVVSKKIDRYNFDMIDINMGCPVPKVVKNGEGAALMKNLKLIGEIVKAVSSNVSMPVSVKIRKGFDENSVNAVEAALVCESAGASAIAVHGRTREQFYSGKADWDIIKAVKAAVGIPVIGNGDVFSPQDAKNMFDYTGCDAVMIARGAQGNPWIFNNIKHFINTGVLLPSPSINTRINMIIRHTSMLIDLIGEEHAIREMRKHISWYLKGIHGACAVRSKVNNATNFNEIKEILACFNFIT